MGSTKKETLKKVAVGCQGGGMHAAFEVGVLTEILKDVAKKKFELVGLSGTSAGALCTLMTWYGLAPKKSGPGSAQQAIDALNHAWDGFTADTPTEDVLSRLAYYAFRAQETETPLLGLSAGMFGISPSSIVSRTIYSWLPRLDVRKQYFDLEYYLTTACPEFDHIKWPRVKTRLLIGATEIVQGCETVFDSALKAGAHPQQINRWRKQLPLSLRGVAASGTLPEFSQAVRIDGGYYWDGGYSQNPPLREFFSGVPREDTPDELWIVRINPQQWPEAPTTRADIVDRENELIGNLSLNKELDFILTVNGMIDSYGGKLAKDYKPVTVRTIKMTEGTADELRYSSKFDRSREFTNRLRDEGTAVGRDWLNRWPGNVGSWPDDAAYR